MSLHFVVLELYTITTVLAHESGEHLNRDFLGVTQCSEFKYFSRYSHSYACRHTKNFSATLIMYQKR